MTNRPPYQSRPTYGGRDTGPSYGQVLEEVRTAGMIETTTEIMVAPTAENEYLCVVRATCTMPSLREGDQFRRYSGLGAAYPRKTGANVIHGVSNPQYYIHTAESRAKKRAWLDALGRGDGLESDVRSEVFAERARQQGAGVVLPALPVRPNPDDKISEEQAQKLAEFLNRSFEQVRDLTRAEASRLYKEHKESAVSGGEE